MPISLRRNFSTSKVPRIDGLFWFLKLLTTAMGEATSDFFVRRFNPEIVVTIGAVVFVVVLWRQLGASRYLTGTYWLAVVMVSVFGTMCADVLHVRFGVPYVVSATGFAVILAGVFVTWWRVEHNLSIHSITTTRRELFYWATVTVTFALGTAVGDMTAYTFHWGYLVSGIIFAFIFCLPAIGFGVFKLNGVAMFWAAYILTRPLGASFADYLGVSHVRGGRNWGSGYVALMFSAFIIIGVVVLATRERARARASAGLDRAGRSRSRD